ncbi:unnamed protein product [Camellia sinensis]
MGLKGKGFSQRRDWFSSGETSSTARRNGILLLEVNRMLRAGGYFAWAAQPVYKHELALEEQWEVTSAIVYNLEKIKESEFGNYPSLENKKIANWSNMCSTSDKKFSLLIVCLPSSSEMINLTSHLCWNLVKEGYIAIWQKPLNNSCYLSREAGTRPPLCDSDDDPDSVWDHSNFVSCVQFCTDGSKFITVSSDKKGILYDAKTGEKIGELSSKDGRKGSIYAVS